jgi:hypothetical protein
MSLANSKKSTPEQTFAWAGAVARIRRGGASSRSGRRSALLGVLTAVYANSSRGNRPADARGSSTSAAPDRS